MDKGCVGMAVGESRELKIPAEEAYGKRGIPGWGIPGEASIRMTLQCVAIADWPAMSLMQRIAFCFWWVLGCGWV